MTDKSLEDSLNEAFDTSVDEPIETTVTEPVTEDNAEPSGRDEKGRFKAKDTLEQAPEQASEQALELEPPKPIKPPPASLSADIKAQWETLPENVRNEMVRREEEFHRKLTDGNSEYHLGKAMKDVITPYMAIINAVGQTPSGAVQQLLSTDYQLRTGSPQQKVALARQLMSDYGIDVTMLTEQQEYVDPTTVSALQQQIAMQAQLQEKMERARIQSEVDAFASDPANVHYEQVREKMRALLSSGQVTSLKEAYDSACWSDPAIRSTLLAKQKADEQAKRNQEIEAKRKAAASVTGSPGLTATNSTAPKKSIEQSLNEAFDAYSGSI